MEKFKVSQVARELGITATAVYRKFKTCSELVQNQIIKENGVTYLTKEGLDALRTSSQKPESETLPQGFEPVHNQFKESSNQQEVIRGLQKTIDSMIVLHGEERQRSDTIIMKLSNDVGSLRNLLEETRKPITLLNAPPKPVKPWEPVRVQPPAMPWYERLWLQMFAPETLRMTTE